jgi:lipid-A-disaccharide synthase-like uncharacterized protein
MQALFDSVAASLGLRSVDLRDGIWILVGFAGQFLFMMRFLWQWIQSERQRRSIIPIAFWYFSIGGGLVLLAYAIHRRDPVFITGQGLGLIVYIRNLLLIRAVRRDGAPADESLAPAARPGDGDR